MEVLNETEILETEGDDDEDDLDASALKRQEALMDGTHKQDLGTSLASPSHSHHTSSPLPGWLMPFADDLERKCANTPMPCPSSVGDIICFESVEIPDVSITRYIAILYAHFRDLTSWAACVTLLRRVEEKGAVALNAYTVHRVTLTALAVALYKTQPGKGELTLPAGPGGVDEEDLASMVRVLVRALDFQLSFSIEEMQSCLAQTSPSRSRSLDFACALLASSNYEETNSHDPSNHDSIEPIRQWVYSCSPTTSQHDIPVTEPSSSPRHFPLNPQSSGSGVKIRLQRLRHSFRKMIKRTISTSTAENKLS